jgi:molybdopterin molybdotransferase
MISVHEAIQLCEVTTKTTNTTVQISLKDALGYVLAKDVRAPINMPPFKQSSMDGYAINYVSGSVFKLVGEVKAGDASNPILKNNEAIRIFTGAPVPDDANVVVIQENVRKFKDSIEVAESITVGMNIRPVGQQIQQNGLALEKGTVLQPAGVAFLASLGIAKVEVFKKPSIAIIVTGNELVMPGKTLKRGEIYESNGIMLVNVLHQIGFNDVTTYKVADDYSKLLNTLKEVETKHNFIMLSGGISVGDYDFVEEALTEIGVNKVFYKVKQKPGKPLFMGKKGSSTFFALPGNPASALSCFYIYAYPVLQKIIGNTYIHLERKNLTAITPFKKKGDRAQFLKALVKNDKVEILDGQASSMIHSFAKANALAFMPEETSTIENGDVVEAIILP